MKSMSIGKRDHRIREYVTPKRIVWKTADAAFENEELLLQDKDSQVLITPDNPVIIRNDGITPGILLDFGLELHGGIQLAIWNCVKKGELTKRAKVRVRFGESVMEAMSEIGGETNATNDHAIRDQILDISFLGMNEFGNTGFRFVRIDLLEEDCFIQVNTIKAIFYHRYLPLKGSFNSSDPLLNQIWDTGAYTVYLNMQDYIWDGIKRDRMVWIGDMHPEVATIQAAFGPEKIVPQSLDFVRDRTTLPDWMNTFPSYSAWWMIIQHDWYMYTGDKAYLNEQKGYLIALLDQMGSHIKNNGTNTMPNPFLDWPTVHNKNGVHAGVHALFILAIEKATHLIKILGDFSAAERGESYLKKLTKYKPNHGNSKQAGALLALSGQEEALQINENVLSKAGAKGVSTFYGYYILQAKALAKDVSGALDLIREYWGGMLSLGATTFWEDFDIDWLQNAARIDQLTPKGKIDVHGTYGDHCYVGYRHSLCHGWASGPTAWLSQHILGIKINEPGCKVIEITPSLGDLEWVEGSFPTPYGTIKVKHYKQKDGSIETSYEAPTEVEIIN
ncbi:alpha-L-rhamnosidase C-terminal domain-containing protein [Gracilibacillus thailandensis]|uniref:Bacterial alpha-L-rhamnosidase n=1 Tax=Gracilibacillus thailandensis TaxID=563735 RepID=A0A6N7QZN1_9BACI|nr:alpha-L-rhamnosidase C-terminal domain-containing protein [Gracilibacillus thailandensis]MRI66335.1 Bacterial alpha-L-rhamnosidase [Gracilibacillus thailandensis]